MRTTLALVCTLLLAAIAMAGPLVTVTPLDASPDKDYQGAESFETTMPPPGWYLDVTNPAATWTLLPLGYEGSRCAYIPMDIMGEFIDERLGFTTSYTADQWLHFALQGQTAVNATLQVWVGEDLVFDFARDWTLPWDQWGLVEIDLSQTNYAGHPNVDFAWQYTGTFAPSLSLDMVGITDEAVGNDVATMGELKALYR